MPWEIRARRTNVVLRDGRDLASPVYFVGVIDWVPFEMLPPNALLDAELEVRAIAEMPKVRPVALPRPMRAASAPPAKVVIPAVAKASLAGTANEAQKTKLERKVLTRAPVTVSAAPPVMSEA